MSSAKEQRHKILANALGSAEQNEVNSFAQDDFLTSAEINILTSLPGAFALFAANGLQLWSNDTAKTMIGANADLLNKANPQYAVDTLQLISQAAHEGKTGSAVIKVQQVDKDGVAQTRTVSLNCSRFEPVEKILPEAFALVSMTDVTVENELTVQLSDARQENEDKNRFFSSMSHELRTPLNAIIGFAELLEGKAAISINDVKRVEYAGLISSSADHLLGLINDILDLSRLDAGKNQAQKEAVDLEASLNTMVRSMMPIAMRKNVDVIIEDNNGIPNINTDKRALTQIFTNILSNAIKFSHESGVVRVKAMRLRNRVKIIVTDNGIGMDTDTQSKLGGLFYQSGDVISENYGGSGLGLSIVYKLVELLGGKIAISSQYGEGTSVSVILPTGTVAASPVPASSNGDVVYLAGVTEKSNCKVFEKSISTGVK